jgi:hypothetical protein
MSVWEKYVTERVNRCEVKIAKCLEVDFTNSYIPESATSAAPARTAQGTMS